MTVDAASGQRHRHDVSVKKIGNGQRMAMRSFRLQMEAQYAVIKALDRVARRLGRKPKLAARVFLHSETILSSFHHFCLSTPCRRCDYDLAMMCAPRQHVRALPKVDYVDPLDGRNGH